MKAKPKIRLIVLLLLLAAVFGCIKKEEYPVEPVISFGSYGVIPDVDGYDSIGVLTISYTDGDGDIGLNDYDTVEPYKYDYFLKFLEWRDGSFQEVQLADTSFTFNSRIPILTPEGKNKNIRGDISMFLEMYYAFMALKSDTIAFEVYIQDRALHKSNVLQTPAYIINRP
jgi:hypothetical protein